MILTLVLAGCGLTSPDWCRVTYHFPVADSLWTLPDSVNWDLGPDTVRYDYPVDGVCPAES